MHYDEPFGFQATTVCSHDIGRVGQTRHARTTVVTSALKGKEQKMTHCHGHGEEWQEQDHHAGKPRVVEHNNVSVLNGKI